MGIFLSLVTLLGCVLGGVVLVVGLGLSGAPQQAAAAAYAMALCVIPYVLKRLHSMAETASRLRDLEAAIKAK